MSKWRQPLRRVSNSDRNFNDPLYIAWRKSVFKRDMGRCQWPKCGTTKKLQAHHIRTWSDYPRLRFEIANGISLCREHHDIVRGNEDSFIRLFSELLIIQAKKRTNI